MGKKRSELPEGDDGRTIVDMNVEGMPWYHKPLSDMVPQGAAKGPKDEMTREEQRAFMWGALKASLLVALVFIGVFFLFILFCDKIWFQ